MPINEAVLNERVAPRDGDQSSPARVSAQREPMTIAALRKRYREGSLTPRRLVEGIAARTAGPDTHHAWIRPLTLGEMMSYVEALEGKDIEALPLFGIPFAIKDNIDLAGVPTTAGCREYAYTPDKSAAVVERLIAAGAIPVGKTNLDQFATGLSGQRSPYGACRNALDPRYASGGSSSGSAVAVALGLAAFSLGTDTAGSGRVPAAFHGLFGLKPTKGVLSTQGVVPACQSLDCVSIFAHSADDAQNVFEVACAVVPGDPYAREWQPLSRRAEPRPRRVAAAGVEASALGGVRFGVPRGSQRQFFGDTSYEQAFEAALARLRKAGAQLVEIDFQPFLDAARLLYEGPWVAERLAAIKPFFDTHAEALHPVTRAIIGGGERWSAADAFAAFDRLAILRMQADAVWERIDAIVMPTSPTTATVEELEADPIGVNAKFGYYTNFVNLLDLSALAVPAGLCAAGPHAGLPFGITFVGRAHDERLLLDLARDWRPAPAAGSTTELGGQKSGLAYTVALPAPQPTRIRMAVVGAHLRGQPLNAQLTQRGARYVQTTATAPVYRLFALPPASSAGIAKPGLVRVAQGGAAIELELWDMPVAAYGSFVAEVPPPLGIGTLMLEDGSQVQGFLCESAGLEGAVDISAFGGWRAYLASL